MSGLQQPPSSSTNSGDPSTSGSQTRRSGPEVPRVSRKRPGPPICNGNVDTWEQASLACKICFETIKEAMVTQCGHSFCNECIRLSLASSPMCPICAVAVSDEMLIPNYALDEMVEEQASAKSLKTEMYEAVRSADADPSSLFDTLSKDNYNKLNLNDIENLMLLLQRKKEVLTVEAEEHQRTLLIEFLNQLLKIKKAQKERIEKEVNLIELDISHISSSSAPIQSEKSNGTADESMTCSSSQLVGYNTQPLTSVESEQSTMASRRKRMYSHFEELTRIYMESRKAELHISKTNDATVPNDGGDVVDYDALDNFGTTLSRISRYHSLKPLATLSYSADLLANSNIVSSIEFDKDNEFFAIAGVTRKIKLFEYATVIGSAVDIHCPNAELTCIAKISCVSWSNYYKNRLASSDYDGCVSLWDASVACKTRSLNEHEKRVWSVDWSNGDPRLLASGSDDSKVKLWSTNTDRSVSTLEAKANVCCVKFCPQNSFVIAFGCADHCIHYYDFRHPRDPIGVLHGHKKAVSYVKFASKDELVSASTDSHLKLWNLNDSMECVRSFKGHVNEKNFVGLATDGNYVACGSENNSLYIYYKYLSRPLFSFKFDNHRTMLDRPRNDESTEFVSAVAWKKGSPVVVAANSQGAIKILELM